MAYGQRGGSGGRTAGGRRRRGRRTARSRTNPPRTRGTATAAGRQRAGMRQYQGRVRSRAAAQRAMTMASGRTASPAASGIPGGLIPSKFRNKITKARNDGTGALDIYMCQGNVITSDGCMKINNKLIINRNYVAKSGGTGKSGPGNRGRRR